MRCTQRLVFRTHALQRMFQRGIDDADVRSVLQAGEVIEDYPEDIPYPSQLILGWVGVRPLHVVVARNAKDREAIVITAYQPDLALWEPGFRKRREQ
jgi:hypothetical protein